MVISIGVVAVVVALALVGWFVWPGWGQPDDAPTDGTEVTSAPTQTTEPADPTTDPEPTDPASGPTTEPEPTDTQSDPTEQQSGSTEAQIDADGRMNGSGYSYAVPIGWTLATESGGGGSGTVEDGAGSDITVWIIRQGMDFCLADVDALQIWVPGTIEPLPDREIGGQPGIGNALIGDDGTYFEMWCVDVAGVTYEIGLNTVSRDSVQPLFVDALDSWEWAAAS